MKVKSLDIRDFHHLRQEVIIESRNYQERPHEDKKIESSCRAKH